MGTEIERYILNVPCTEGFSQEFTLPDGYEFEHIDVVYPDDTEQQISIPPATQSFLLTLPKKPKRIYLCRKQSTVGRLLYLGHARGDFFPVFAYNSKFTLLNVYTPLNCLNPIVGWKYSDVLSDTAPRADWLARPNRSLTQLLSDIAAGPNDFRIAPVLAGYTDVSISEGTIVIETDINIATNPQNVVLNFGGMSRDNVIGYISKNFVINSITFSSTISTADYKIRTNKLTDWESIAFKPFTDANKTVINNDIATLPTDEWEMMVYATYTGTNNDGIITLNIQTS